ncbi:MAG: N-acetylmuramoyl-L-alanine amidase-like domain-containing protein [Myxococcota bacterium]|nr:N-acetylmuramoyl-L-alanine amidase-like domain-containing protein [Myxococcota bacterium]
MFIILSLFAIAQPSLSVETIRDLLYQSHPNQIVSYNDHLGEGPRHFDTDPRLNWNRVNCTTWWQQIIAKGYAKTDTEELRILDEIRYYFGQVSFGTRKHFLDRALYLDPTPFIDVQTMEIPFCEGTQKTTVPISLNHFRNAKKYKCSLYREEVSDIDIHYMSPNQTHRCAKNLPDGIYLLLPIAGEQYLDIWAKDSGPMGHVHGFILDKDGVHLQIYHASLEKGKIATEMLKEYIRTDSAQLFVGYKIYALQSKFYRDPRIYSYNPNNIRKIQHCETKRYGTF